jgi:phosphatidate cytidylyltransferase
MSIKKRVPTAILLLLLVFVAIQYFSRLAFFIVLQILILIALFEFYNLAQKREHVPRKVLGVLMSVFIALSFFLEQISLEMALFACILLGAFYFVFAVNKIEKLKKFPSGVALTLFGAIYLSFTLNYFNLLREGWGPYYIYFMLAVIFFGDTGAYFFGKLLGKHKMTPVASPNKTWEGSIGGILTACIGGVLAQQLILKEALLWKAIVFAFLIHLAAQVSDPVESLFKRAAGVKDSSNMLPGHGGFLDRIDSMILAVPLFYYLLKFIGMG